MSFTLGDSSIYTDGVNFNTPVHAMNLYNASNPTTGVYSKLNGRLDKTSLSSDFRLKREYVWPGLMANAAGSFSLLPVHYFNDSAPAGGAPYSESYRPEIYGPIAGTSVKFFLPYESVCFIDIGSYLSMWRPFYVDDATYQKGKGTGFDILSKQRDKVMSGRARLRLVVDKDVVQERGLPFSAQMSPAFRDGIMFSDADDDVEGFSQGDIRVHEVSQGFYMTMHATKRLAPGWHEAHLEYSMSAGTIRMTTTVKRSTVYPNVVAIVGQRLFCGIRNARVLAVKHRPSFQQKTPKPSDGDNLAQGAIKLSSSTLIPPYQL